MKNKYQRLTKIEKKACKEMYYNTLQGRDMHLRFIRLNLIGTIGLIFCVYLVGNSVITQQKIEWYDYCILIPLCLASLTFIIGVFFLKRKVLNQFALKIPRFKNK